MTQLKKTIPADLYKMIHKDIIYLHLPPSSQIKEITLSKHYNVSRTPVRQVIQRLIADKFIIYEKGRGNIVAPLTWDDYLHLYQIRSSMELLSIHLAVLNAKDSDLQAIEENIQKQEQIINDQDYAVNFIELDKEFHLLLARAGKNKRLYDLLGNIYDHYSRYNFLSGFRGRLNFAINEHKAIYQTLQTKNEPLASLQMKQHLDNIHSVISYELPHKL